MRIGSMYNTTNIYKESLKKIPRDEIPKYIETCGVIRGGRKGKNKKRRKNMRKYDEHKEVYNKLIAITVLC